MDDKPISADVCFYNRNNAYSHMCEMTIPDDVEPLGTIKVEAILVDQKGTAIQKCSEDQELNDSICPEVPKYRSIL